MRWAFLVPQLVGRASPLRAAVARKATLEEIAATARRGLTRPTFRSGTCSGYRFY